MKETGIPFRPEMVRAILEGRKTQTRRILKGSTEFKGPYNPKYLEMHKNAPGWKTICPHGGIGDHLWVKEGVVTHASIPQIVGYVNDGCKATERWEKQRRAMFMPKWAARIWLEITEVRVQRLQEISQADVKAEGISEVVGKKGVWDGGGPAMGPSPTIAFMRLWESINGKTHPWSSNPWLWCIAFKRIKVG